MAKKDKSCFGRFSWLPVRYPLHFAGRQQRRVAVCLGVAVIGAIGMVATWRAPAAFACGKDNSCYAVANSKTADLGVYGNIYVTCNYTPENADPALGYFATNEIWDGDTAGDYWTEVGIFTGADDQTDTGYYTKDWFWADKRPGQSYYEHVGLGQPSVSTGTYYDTEILWDGNNTWNVYGGADFTELGQSSPQPLTSSGDMDAGTEYTVPRNGGMRNVGTVSGLQYKNLQDQWLYWGTRGAADTDLGPGGYITPSYNSTTSSVGWVGPC